MSTSSSENTPVREAHNNTLADELQDEMMQGKIIEERGHNESDKNSNHELLRRNALNVDMTCPDGKDDLIQRSDLRGSLMEEHDEVCISLLEYNILKGRLNELRREYELKDTLYLSSQVSLAKLIKQNNGLRVEVENLKKKVADDSEYDLTCKDESDEISKLRTELAERDEVVANLENKLREIQRYEHNIKEKNINQKQEIVKEEMDSLKSEVEAKDEQISNIENDFRQKIQTELEKEREKFDEHEKELNKEIMKLKSQLFDKNEEIISLKDQVEEFKDCNRKRQDSLQNVSAESKEKSETNQLLFTELNNLKIQILEMDEFIDELEGLVSNYPEDSEVVELKDSSDHQNSKSKCKFIMKEFSKLTSQLKQLENEVQSLKEDGVKRKEEEEIANTMFKDKFCKMSSEYEKTIAEMSKKIQAKTRESKELNELKKSQSEKIENLEELLRKSVSCVKAMDQKISLITFAGEKLFQRYENLKKMIEAYEQEIKTFKCKENYDSIRITLLEKELRNKTRKMERKLLMAEEKYYQDINRYEEKLQSVVKEKNEVVSRFKPKVTYDVETQTVSFPLCFDMQKSKGHQSLHHAFMKDDKHSRGFKDGEGETFISEEDGRGRNDDVFPIIIKDSLVQSKTLTMNGETSSRSCTVGCTMVPDFIDNNDTGERCNNNNKSQYSLTTKEHNANKQSSTVKPSPCVEKVQDNADIKKKARIFGELIREFIKSRSQEEEKKVPGRNAIIDSSDVSRGETLVINTPEKLEEDEEKPKANKVEGKDACHTRRTLKTFNEEELKESSSNEHKQEGNKQWSPVKNQTEEKEGSVKKERFDNFFSLCNAPNDFCNESSLSGVAELKNECKLASETENKQANSLKTQNQNDLRKTSSNGFISNDVEESSPRTRESPGLKCVDKKLRMKVSQESTFAKKVVENCNKRYFSDHEVNQDRKSYQQTCTSKNGNCQALIKSERGQKHDQNEANQTGLSNPVKTTLPKREKTPDIEYFTNQSDEGDKGTLKVADIPIIKENPENCKVGGNKHLGISTGNNKPLQKEKYFQTKKQQNFRTEEYPVKASGQYLTKSWNKELPKFSKKSSNSDFGFRDFRAEFNTEERAFFEKLRSKASSKNSLNKNWADTNYHQKRQVKNRLFSGTFENENKFCPEHTSKYSPNKMRWISNEQYKRLRSKIFDNEHEGQSRMPRNHNCKTRHTSNELGGKVYQPNFGKGCSHSSHGHVSQLEHSREANFECKYGESVNTMNRRHDLPNPKQSRVFSSRNEGISDGMYVSNKWDVGHMARGCKRLNLTKREGSIPVHGPNCLRKYPSMIHQGHCTNKSVPYPNYRAASQCFNRSQNTGSAYSDDVWTRHEVNWQSQTNKNVWVNGSQVGRAIPNITEHSINVDPLNNLECGHGHENGIQTTSSENISSNMINKALVANTQADACPATVLNTANENEQQKDIITEVFLIAEEQLEGESNTTNRIHCQSFKFKNIVSCASIEDCQDLMLSVQKEALIPNEAKATMQ